MNKEIMEIIFRGDLEKNLLTEEEKEIALKILNDLEGTLVIRANSILEFCLKAIQYSKLKLSTQVSENPKEEKLYTTSLHKYILKTLNEMRSCFKPLEEKEK